MLQTILHRCKAVAFGNVGVSDVERHLQGKCIRTSSLRVFYKASPTASKGIRKGGFLFVSPVASGGARQKPKGERKCSMVSDFVERFRSVFKYAGLILEIAGIFNIIHALVSDASGHLRIFCASVAILFAGALLLGIYILLKKLVDARIMIEEASSFDYKFCADIKSQSVGRLLSRLNVSLDRIDANAPVAIKPGDKRFISLDDFFSDTGANYSSDFNCMPMKSSDKIGKIILQVSFVPVDCNGNTPLILRMPDQHSSARVEKPEFTFVSFSPVPRRYGNSFDLLTCYNREVSSTPSAFAEIGMYLSRVDKKDKRMKSVLGSVYYLFWVFAARYDDISFLKDGRLDKDSCRRAFAPVGANHGLLFTKDHDEIIHAMPVKDLSSAADCKIRDTDKCTDKTLGTILSDRRFKIFRSGRSGTGKARRMSFDMTKAKMKGVEKCIAKELSSCDNVSSAFTWEDVVQST